MTAPKTTFTYENVSPLFLVADLDSAATFYCETLGFEKKWAWGDPAVRIGIGPKNSSGPSSFEIHLINDAKIGPSGTSFVFFHVTNVDALYQRCRDQGAEIYLELEERPWGLKDFRIKDPFGNRMGFGEVI